MSLVIQRGVMYFSLTQILKEVQRIPNISLRIARKYVSYKYQYNKYKHRNISLVHQFQFQLLISSDQKVLKQNKYPLSGHYDIWFLKGAMEALEWRSVRWRDSARRTRNRSFKILVVVNNDDVVLHGSHKVNLHIIMTL